MTPFRSPITIFELGHGAARLALVLRWWSPPLLEAALDPHDPQSMIDCMERLTGELWLGEQRLESYIVSDLLGLWKAIVFALDEPVRIGVARDVVAVQAAILDDSVTLDFSSRGRAVFEVTVGMAEFGASTLVGRSRIVAALSEVDSELLASNVRCLLSDRYRWPEPRGGPPEGQTFIQIT